jgi:hypothetical protein
VSREEQSRYLDGEIVIDTDAAGEFLEDFVVEEPDISAVFAIYRGAQSRISDCKSWQWITG